MGKQTFEKGESYIESIIFYNLLLDICIIICNMQVYIVYYYKIIYDNI